MQRKAASESTKSQSCFLSTFLVNLDSRDSRAGSNLHSVSSRLQTSNSSNQKNREHSWKSIVTMKWAMLSHKSVSQWVHEENTIPPNPSCMQLQCCWTRIDSTNVTKSHLKWTVFDRRSFCYLDSYNPVFAGSVHIVYVLMLQTSIIVT